MIKIKLSYLFNKCLNARYTHKENSVSFATERVGSLLYILFEHSNGGDDWKNNIDFPSVPYSAPDGTIWRVHRGFLRVWKSAYPYFADAIADTDVKKIVTVGYSHGGALAMLCHEYIWYHRADIRSRIEGYGFGAPRVFFGPRIPSLMERWERFTVVRNIDDVVTHLPPALLGYSHVGSLLEIGERGKYSKFDAHRPENILTELERYESAR